MSPRPQSLFRDGRTARALRRSSGSDLRARCRRSKSCRRHLLRFSGPLVESAKSPGWVGRWVICGDCPTDYVTCSGDRTPRSAIEAITARWREASASLAKGEQHPDFAVGDRERRLWKRSSQDSSETAPRTDTARDECRDSCLRSRIGYWIQVCRRRGVRNYCRPGGSLSDPNRNCRSMANPLFGTACIH
jgi:hypothetical protein